MQKVFINNINNCKKNFDFYNFNKQQNEAGYRLAVLFPKKNEAVTYSDLQYGGDFKKYAAQREKLTELLFCFLREIVDENYLLLKYNNKWIINPTLSPELKNLFKKNKIKNNFNGGILCEKDYDGLRLFVESIFMYNSFLNIILPCSRVIITPTDHMDIFFDFTSLEVSSTINNIAADLGLVICSFN